MIPNELIGSVTQFTRYASAAKHAIGCIGYWADKANSVRSQCGFYPIQFQGLFIPMPKTSFSPEQEQEIMFCNSMQQSCKKRLAAITSAALTMVAFELTGSDIYFSIEL